METTSKLKYLLVRWLWVIIGIVFLGMLLSAIQKKRTADAMEVAINIVKVDDRSFITETEIHKIIMDEFGYELNGIPIGSLDLGEMESTLEADPMIKNADVFVDALHKVCVTITQREPLVRIIEGSGQHYYLDAEASKMPLSKSYTPRVIVASGHIPRFEENFMENEDNVLRQIHEIAGYISKDQFLNSMMEQIYVEKDQEIHLIPRLGEQKIILGDTYRLKEKLENLKDFYREGVPYTGWNKYKTINLKFQGQVVCTKN